MDDASQQDASQAFRPRAQSGASRRAPVAPHTRGAPFDFNHDVHDTALPALALHLAVPPGVTLTWHVRADTTLRVHGAQVWVTRACSPYDHWLNPGDTLRLARGERIWLSTDADVPARVALTSAWQPRVNLLQRVLERLSTWSPLTAPSRAR